MVVTSSFNVSGHRKPFVRLPEGIASVAAEEKLFDFVTLTAEPGIIGGIPQGGLDFGAAINAESIIDQNQMFDFYDGGGLDLACLGMAQVNGRGDVNVSLFNGRLAGAGGFINISQNARRLIFAGTFTTGGLKTSIVDGQPKILSEGRSAKFIDKVDQITFSGKLAATNKQPVLYVIRDFGAHVAPKLVWDSFGSWLRTIRPGIPPLEFVVGNALRLTLPAPYFPKKRFPREIHR